MNITGRDPKPEILRLEELAASIRRGEIRLPKFQRPFVWDQQDMLDLWDSIFNGYPIGSVLLWHSSERLKSEREIMGFSVTEEVIERYPTNYLLDGQQRLTTVCGALFWDGADPDSQWAIHFDLESERFLYPRGPEETRYFPLNKLINTSDFIRQCMKFESHLKKSEYYARAEQLLRSVKDYKVAVVRIGDVSLNEVAPIFERINSTGRKLTMVDLMRAATWRDGFDLSDAIGESTRAFEKQGFDVSDAVTLRSIAAAAGLGINKGDIDRLRTLGVPELETAVHSSRDGISRALTFLQSTVGINDSASLPYTIQLTYLAEFFRLKPVATADESQALTEWFWRTSVSRYFAGANTGQNARDLHAMQRFAVDGISMPGDAQTPIECTAFLSAEFNLRTAASTTLVLLLKSWSFFVKPSRAGVGTTIRRKRSDFIDVLRNTPYEGRNIGQVLRADSGGDALEISPFFDREAFALLDGAFYDRFVDHRAQLICNVLTSNTGRPCTSIGLAAKIVEQVL